MTSKNVAKFNFEKLEVYKEAVKLVDQIYQCTSAFPHTEVFSLTSQLRRASTSIACNIAEGSSRGKKGIHSFSKYRTEVNIRVSVTVRNIEKEKIYQ